MCMELLSAKQSWSNQDCMIDCARVLELPRPARTNGHKLRNAIQRNIARKTQKGTTKGACAPEHSTSSTHMIEPCKVWYCLCFNVCSNSACIILMASHYFSAQDRTSSVWHGQWAQALVSLRPSPHCRRQERKREQSPEPRLRQSRRPPVTGWCRRLGNLLQRQASLAALRRGRKSRPDLYHLQHPGTESCTTWCKEQLTLNLWSAVDKTCA